MTCTKAQSLITPFIKDQITNSKELEEFLHHVNSCPDCKEELEVYYALLTAMKQLDEDKDMSDDFSMELTAKLENAEEQIIHERFSYYRKKGILLLMIILLALFINIGYMLQVEEDPVVVTKSKHKLRIEFMEQRFDQAEAALLQYLLEQELMEEIRDKDKSDEVNDPQIP
ncbi:MAG: hypothetical protein K0S47_1883 [Herbinix sp.]|jgi:tRNA threonylcarbamoyladenosine modification (KEOPS) complex Cgi121 subunit|nr:hypothetical protein [Herbinix sp.]